jgi:hypothetical protein
MFYILHNELGDHDAIDRPDDVGRGWPVSDAEAGLMRSEGCNLSAREFLSRENVGVVLGNRKQRKNPTTENHS